MGWAQLKLDCWAQIENSPSELTIKYDNIFKIMINHIIMLHQLIVNILYFFYFIIKITDGKNKK